MNSLNKEIRDRIEQFSEELAGLIRQAALESVQEALGHDGTVRGTTRKKTGKATLGRPKKKAAVVKKTAGRRTRRTPEQLAALCSKIASYVNSHPGKGVEAIGAALGLASVEMQRPVAVLLETKKLKKKGKLRGTTYYARGASVVATKRLAKKKTVRRKKATRKG